MIQFSLETPSTLPTQPEFYSALYASGNISGQHVFDGWVLDWLTDLYDLVKDADVSYGEIVSWKDKVTTEVKGSFLIHFNGRVGARDLSLDVVVIPIDTLRQLPEDVQTILYGLEKVPGGRRS